MDKHDFKALKGFYVPPLGKGTYLKLKYLETHFGLSRAGVITLGIQLAHFFSNPASYNDHTEGLLNNPTLHEELQRIVDAVKQHDQF